MKLFYNYDPRILEMADHHYHSMRELLAEFNLTHDSICFELSERHKVEPNQKFKDLLHYFKTAGFKLALDDFGAGFANFELFYHAEPDILKCDRFLIHGIDQDLRKKTFCSHIVALAKLLGVFVVAEGVETEGEFQTCSAIGCDLIQGYYLQKPTLNPEEILLINAKLTPSENNSTPNLSRETELLAREIVPIEPININNNIKVLFEKFHHNLQYNFFPVTDQTGYPLGIIHEKAIKKYVYSPYGKDLLHNKSLATSLTAFVSKCPIVDINTSQEKILAMFVANLNSEGIMITKSHKYYGFLTAKSLLHLINEKNLAYAREINPLTQLPGNILINQYISETYQEQENIFYFIYYDFNDFKPFNDLFGFSRGDQAIVLFAAILKKEYSGQNEFIGHIGGDDFFIGVKTSTPASLLKEYRRAEGVIATFQRETAVLYSSEIQQKGYYIAKDRDGNHRKMNMLSVCAAILEVPAGERDFYPEEISVKLAELKKEVKSSILRRIAT
jgi:diguanylate cyclase (GGDEF)-like protein